MTRIAIILATLALPITAVVGCASSQPTDTYGTRVDCPAEDSCYPEYDENGWHIEPGQREGGDAALSGCTTDIDGYCVEGAL